MNLLRNWVRMAEFPYQKEKRYLELVEEFWALTKERLEGKISLERKREIGSRIAKINQEARG